MDSRHNPIIVDLYIFLITITLDCRWTNALQRHYRPSAFTKPLELLLIKVLIRLRMLILPVDDDRPIDRQQKAVEGGAYDHPHNTHHEHGRGIGQQSESGMDAGGLHGQMGADYVLRHYHKHHYPEDQQYQETD